MAQYGPNELAEHKANPLLKFLSYFWGPIPWMIEIAVVLSGAVGHWPDFFIILLLLVANGVVGYTEERQAGNAIEALKAKLAINARVKRDDTWITAPARELVPGDVIRLRLGDIVPADARLLDGDEIEVDQSALTGESLPATRLAGDAVFSGSIVRQGEIGALVYATGTHSYFGKTAELVADAHTVSHFQRAVLKIGNYLIILAVALVTIIVVTAILRGDAILTTLQFALVLTVAAIPVAMPTVLSVTMAVGARLLATKQAIVSRLVAIEELAGVDVLCADKTGTLTQNSLTLGIPFSIDGVTPATVILNGAWASRADNDDPIDRAVLGGIEGTKSCRLTQSPTSNPSTRCTNAPRPPSPPPTGPPSRSPRVPRRSSLRWPRTPCRSHPPPIAQSTTSPPADSGRWAWPALTGTATGSSWACCRCSTRPATTLQRPSRPPQRWASPSRWSPVTRWLSRRRPRPRSAWAPTSSTPQPWVMRRRTRSAAVAESILAADGFAQVFPEHKYHLIDVLQKHGHIVGMTGDGVNDAPALKKADCGIAVSGATDAARAAADIVLLTPASR